MRAAAVAVLLLLAIASPALAGRAQLGPRLQQRLQQQQQQQQQHQHAKPLKGVNLPPPPPPPSAPPKVCTGPKNDFEAVHYAIEHPVANYRENCQHKDNMPCTEYGEQVVYDHSAPKTGCNLYAKALHICKSASAASSCPNGDFAYSGDYKTCDDHVITIAKHPIRGMEDVWQHGDARVKDHWKTFWSDSIGGTSGHDRNTGFDADKGALVINPAAHREYHQLHIHGGTSRTPQFEACLNDPAHFPAKLQTGTWYTARCAGLSEGGVGKDKAVAHLAYQVMSKNDLDKAWDLWKEAVQKKAEVTDANGKPISADSAAFFSGLLVTRRTKNPLPQGEVIVAAYWPSNMTEKAGLGRGHFVLEGLPGKC